MLLGRLGLGGTKCPQIVASLPIRHLADISKRHRPVESKLTSKSLADSLRHHCFSDAGHFVSLAFYDQIKRDQTPSPLRITHPIRRLEKRLHQPPPQVIIQPRIGLQLHSNKMPQEVQFKNLKLETFPEDKLLTVKADAVK